MADTNQHTKDHVDDYYAQARAKAQKETRSHAKAARDHVNEALHQLIPHYDVATEGEKVLLVRVNNVLINRFEGPGMMYWNIFRSSPQEIKEYPDYFEGVLTEGEMEQVITFLEEQEHAPTQEEVDELSEELVG